MKKAFAVFSLVILLATVIIIPLQTFALDVDKFYLFDQTLNLPASSTETVYDGLNFIAYYNGHEFIITKVTVNAGDGNRTIVFSYTGGSFIAYGQLRNVWYLDQRYIYLQSSTDQFDIFLSDYAILYDPDTQSDYDKGYEAGYQEGYSNGEFSGYNVGYEQGLAQGKLEWYDQGYADGYTDGRLNTESADLGKNLLGNTLKAPFDALNQFTLFEANIAGVKTPITLGMVVGSVIAFSLFIAFLKLFAGG